MDTSKQYIKMCEKAEEIQDLWINRRAGDFCSTRWARVTRIVGFHCNFSQPVEKNYTFLPRQDQLQNMVIGRLNAGQLSMIFEDWRQENIPNLNNNYSMEQLWLCYVMFKKYGKTWNGETWEKV